MADARPTQPEPDLTQAYEQGNFSLLRSRANQLLSDPNASEQQRAEAKAYKQRVSVDVAVYATLGFALLLFCAIVLRYG